MRINGLSQTLIDRAAPGEGCAQVVRVVKELSSEGPSSSLIICPTPMSVLRVSV